MAIGAFANGRSYIAEGGKPVMVISKSKEYGTKRTYAIQPKLECSGTVKRPNVR